MKKQMDKRVRQAKEYVKRADAAKREMARILRKWDMAGTVHIKPMHMNSHITMQASDE